MRSRDRFPLWKVSAVVLSVVGLVGCQYLFDFLDDQPTAVASPTYLAATASASAISISLSWTASTTSGAAYRVYRGTSAGGEAATPIGTSTTAGYADAASTLQPNTTYYYYVTAVSGGVESARSNEAHATTKNTGGTVVPAPAVTFHRVAPSVFLDPPYNYDLEDQYVHLIWQGPSSGVSYTVLRSTDPDFSSPEGTDVTSLNTSWFGYANGYFYDESAGGYDFWDNTASFGVNYYYVVYRIDDADGAVSPYSNVVTAGAPAPTNVIAVDNGDGTFTVSWDPVPSAYDYDIEFADSYGMYLDHYQMHNASTSITLSYSAYGFENGEDYYFLVNAYAGDWGYYSLSDSLTYSAQ